MQTTDTTSRTRPCDKGSSPAAVGQEAHDKEDTLRKCMGDVFHRGMSFSLLDLVVYTVFLSCFSSMSGVLFLLGRLEDLL
jgi:hypothetical protein